MKKTRKLFSLMICFLMLLTLTTVNADENDNSKTSITLSNDSKTVIERKVINLNDDTSIRSVVLCSCGGTTRTELSRTYNKDIYYQKDCTNPNHLFGVFTIYYEYDKVKYECNSCGDRTIDIENHHEVYEHTYRVYP